jgi:hypothetical protein
MVAYPSTPLPKDLRLGAGGQSAFLRFFDWVAASRAHRVICLIIGIWLINAFDLVLTLLSARDGLLVELNPVARHMLTQGSWPLVLYKIGLVLIGTYPLLRFRHTRIAELGALTCLALYAMLAVHWNDCYAVFTLTETSDAGWNEYEGLLGS